MASSGLISIASAETLPNKSFLIGGWFGTDNSEFFPRFLISPMNHLELGFGIDFLVH